MDICFWNFLFGFLRTLPRARSISFVSIMFSWTGFQEQVCNYLREANSALSLFLSSLLRFFEKQRPSDYLYKYTELISEPLPPITS
jgi:hypothetical protein